MANKYTVEDGDIKLELSQIDMETFMQDTQGIRHLLEPEIRVDGRHIMFRECDIKMIDPIHFFNKTIPLRLFTKTQTYAILGFFIFLSLISYSLDATLLDYIFMVCGLLVVAAFHSLFNVTVQFHEWRKVCYAKASTLSYFYCILLSEAYKNNEEIEAVNRKLQVDYDDIKEVIKTIKMRLPIDKQHLIPDTFPDGEPTTVVKKLHS